MESRNRDDSTDPVEKGSKSARKCWFNSERTMVTYKAD